MVTMNSIMCRPQVKSDHPPLLLLQLVEQLHLVSICCLHQRTQLIQLRFHLHCILQHAGVTIVVKTVVIIASDTGFKAKMGQRSRVHGADALYPASHKRGANWGINVLHFQKEELTRDWKSCLLNFLSLKQPQTRGMMTVCMGQPIRTSLKYF